MKKENEKYEGISRHVETLYIKGVSNCCDKSNDMEDRITTIIEEGRYNGLPSDIVSEQILYYTKSIEKENEGLKEKLSDIERYILSGANGCSSNGWLKGYCAAMSIIHKEFFKTPEQKQATDIIENANEELLKELKKQLL